MFANPRTARRSRGRRVTGSFWFQLVLAFVVMGVVLTLVAKPYWVPSESMQQTLQVGDRVLVNRLAYVGAQPATGDIVVFDADESWGAHALTDENPLKSFARWAGEVSGFGPSGPHTLIKRVIAGPGQTMTCCSSAGAIVVDGVPLDEPYVFGDYLFTPGTLDCASEVRSMRCFAEVTVPEGAYLVLGDHRGNSSDSAMQCRGLLMPDATCWRWAHREDIVGKTVAIVWPVQRWAVP